MSEFVLDTVKQFLFDHWMKVLSLGSGLVLVAMLIGSLKKLVAKLFDWGMGVGNTLAEKLTAKPKATALFGCVLVIAIPSFMLGWRSGPIREVVKYEQVEVKDVAAINRLQSEIGRLQGLLDAAAGDKSDVLSKAVNFETQLTSAKEQIATLNRTIVEANNRNASLRSELELVKPTPKPDVERGKELVASIDRGHMKALVSEYHKDGNGDRDKYFLRHSWNSWDYAGRVQLTNERTRALGLYNDTYQDHTPYHKKCKTCKTNRFANEELDKLYKAHPDWDEMTLED